MADEEKTDSGEGAAAPKKGKLKLIIAVVGFLVVLGAGAGGWFFFMRGHGEEQHAEAPPPKPPSFVDVPDMLVNLVGAPGERVQYLNGPVPAGLPHVRTGTIEVQVRPAAEGAALAAEPGSDAERLARLREILRPQALFHKLDTVGLEEIVVSFIETIRREERLLRLISPVKAYSEYTYTHASNVTVLSLVQAQSLGITGETLHEIGMAALLHDVGKLHIANEILDKSGKLDDREWSEIRKHPLYGAWHLSRIEGLTRLAPIVAIEHHLRYDGQGYPRLEAYRAGQHLCSQIVSIADFFDALRSKRPYKKDWEITEILALLRKGAGTEFNPRLVDNLARILVLALKEA